MGGVSANPGLVGMSHVRSWTLNNYLQKLTLGLKWRRNSSNLLHGLLGTSFDHSSLGLLSTFDQLTQFHILDLQGDILVSEDKVLVPRNSLPAHFTPQSISDNDQKKKQRSSDVETKPSDQCHGKTFLESARRRRAFRP